jgi:hypothetical protein
MSMGFEDDIFKITPLAIDINDTRSLHETFEFRLKPGKSSFLRKQESSPFKTFWIPAFAGMTKSLDFQRSLSKVSR